MSLPRHVSGIILCSFALTLGLSSPAAECVSPSPGLVSWWRAENNGLDSVGTNNGIAEAGTSFVSGKVQQAFSLNPVDGFVRVPASPSLDVGSGPGFTIETWINLKEVTNKHSIAEWNNGSGWGVHFHLDPISFNAGPGTLYANIVSSGGTWNQIRSAANTISTNAFHHVALTYDKSSGVARLFRDGLIVAQQTFASFTPHTTFDLYLGRRPSPG
jgi:hypothetical protein